MSASLHKEAIEQAKQLLKESILEKEDDLAERIHCFDEELLVMARELSNGVMSEVANEIAGQEEEKLRKRGLVAQKRTATPFLPSSDASK
jgi:hypothetical protein